MNRRELLEVVAAAGIATAGAAQAADVASPANPLTETCQRGPGIRVHFEREGQLT
jgi:hypothetical protein